MQLTRKLSMVLLSLMVAVSMLTTVAFAEAGQTIAVDDFTLTIYGDDPSSASVYLNGYAGTESDLVLPTHVIYNGKKYKITAVGEGALKGNKYVKSLVVPAGYDAILSNAFRECPNLESVTLGNTGSYYFGNDIFTGCPNLHAYNLGNQTFGSSITSNLGIGKDTSGNIMSGVTAFVTSGSEFDAYLKNENNKSNGNKVKLVYKDDPAASANITKVIPGNGKTTPPTDPTKQMGKDGTPYGQGAAVEATNKALTALKGEGDKKGMVHNKIKFKYKKVGKKSITLGWKKPAGTAKVIVYGNKCGKSTKYVKLTETTKTSLTVKKVAGKAVKKGTYYKFVAVAVDKNGKVVSTSKTIHVATKGGKVTNNKAVKIKAKSGGKYKTVKSLSLKKGKTKKLKVKASKAEKKKKVQNHIPFRYESTNKNIATVSSKGVVKGVKKGTCKVYAYAQNGVFKSVTVKVK